MLDAALDLAAHGWRVFPCRWAGEHAKSPLTVHGHLEATTDPATIRAWWGRYPHAMIGAPVPEPLLVLDVDPRNGGDAAKLGDLPVTLTAVSGRGDGGQHFYFLRPSGTFTSTKLPKGIDLKVNGYCIVPPSIHPSSGKRYVWHDTDPAPLPLHLRELLRPAPPRTWPSTYTSGQQGLDALVRVVAEAVEGGQGGTGRNDRLFWAACRAMEEGHDVTPIQEAAISTGLSEIEVRRTIGSAYRKVS